MIFFGAQTFVVVPNLYPSTWTVTKRSYARALQYHSLIMSSLIDGHWIKNGEKGHTNAALGNRGTWSTETQGRGAGREELMLLDTIGPKFVIETRSADLEQLGRFQTVSGGLRESVNNPGALRLGDSLTRSRP